MPRYHLNLFNDVDVTDEEGLECRDLPAAKEAAIRAARELMAEHIMQGRPINLGHRIDVTGDNGVVFATISFRELVTIEDDEADRD